MFWLSVISIFLFDVMFLFIRNGHFQLKQYDGIYSQLMLAQISTLVANFCISNDQCPPGNNG